MPNLAAHGLRELRRIVGRRMRMRRSRLLLGCLCAATLGLAACGEGDGQGDGDGALGGAAADCVGGLVVDGVWYQPDWNSPIPDEAELGEVVATVEGPWDCYISPEELGDGVFATGIPNGSEVRLIGTRTSDDALATVSTDGVAVFRSTDSMSLANALDDGIVAIGINSEYDGTTRFATIDDPEVIARLVDEARAVEQESSLDGLNEGMRYFIEFVHPDGLSTSFPYGVERAQLSDRIVGEVWAEAITTAMAQSGGAPNVDGLIVTAGVVEAPTHPLGACRLDRTDVTAAPGEIVTVAGDAVADEMIEPWWWINPTRRRGRSRARGVADRTGPARAERGRGDDRRDLPAHGCDRRRAGRGGVLHARHDRRDRRHRRAGPYGLARLHEPVKRANRRGVRRHRFQLSHNR